MPRDKMLMENENKKIIEVMDENNKISDFKEKISDYLAIKKLEKLYKSVPKVENEISEEIPITQSTITIEDLPPPSLKEVCVILLLYSGVFILFAAFLFGFIFMPGLSITGILILSCIDVFLLILGCKLIYNRDLIFSEKVNWLSLLTYLIPLIMLLVGFTVIFISGSSINFVENLNFATQDPVSNAIPVVLMIYFVLRFLKSYILEFDKSMEKLSKKDTYQDYTNYKVRTNHKISKHISCSLLIAFLSLFAFFYFELDVVSTILGVLIVLIFINSAYFYFSDLILDVMEKRNEKKRAKFDSKKKSEKGSPSMIDNAIVPKSFLKQKSMLSFKKVFAFLTLKHYLIIALIVVFVVLAYIFNLFHLRDNSTKISTVYLSNPLLIGLSLVILVVIVLLPLLNKITSFFIRIVQKILQKNVRKYFKTIFISLLFFFVLKVLVFNFKDSNMDWVVSLILSPILSIISNKLRMIRKITD